MHIREQAQQLKNKETRWNSITALVAIKNIVLLVFFFKKIVIDQLYYPSVWHKDDHPRKLLLGAWVLSLDDKLTF